MFLIPCLSVSAPVIRVSIQAVISGVQAPGRSRGTIGLRAFCS
jgi:hypothetical protein